MKDKGSVVTTKEDLAQVEVQCLIESCQNCTAQSLCVGQNQAKGLLMVKNPLNARAGDEVEIEIPETKYSRALILLFGSLLAASLFGAGGGYVLSSLLSLSPSGISLLGFLLALALAGACLSRYFCKRNKAHLYPEIINIIRKGDCHG